jgi:transmembrane sensor
MEPSPPGPADPVEEGVVEAAIAWIVRERDGLSDDQKDDLSRWLEAREAHRLAYADAARAWAVTGALTWRDDGRRMLADARRAKRGRTHGRLAMAASVLLATLAAASVIGYLALPGAVEERTIATGPGQRAVVTLSDGSKVTLDQGTRLDVRMSRSLRSLRLANGQVEFEVAKATRPRPFVVEAAGRQVVATGTVFTVDLLPTTLEVTLLEGHVVVGRAGDDPGRPAPGDIALAPEQRLAISRVSHAVTRTVVDPLNAAAWKSGRLAFEAVPLSEAVERVNRYAAKPIRIRSAAAAARRISGVFTVGDSEIFAEAAAEQLDLAACPSADGSISLAPGC